MEVQTNEETDQYIFSLSYPALAAGVFYREFTKFNGFTGKTTLGVIHTHLFVLGVLLFLILALFANSRPDILENRQGKDILHYAEYFAHFIFRPLYLFAESCSFKYSVIRSCQFAISGIAGVTHIMLTISLVLFFLLLKSVSKEAAVE